jgi:acyl CoA:acetate/3-ketoacid CoA transferase alpha subunit
MTAVFKVQGFDVTTVHVEAGMAVMVGNFTANEVGRAMAKAGVKDLPGQSYTVGRAADRLLQRERRAGRIKFAAGTWEKVS